MFLKKFNRAFHKVYPEGFGLKKTLSYYLLKRQMTKKIISYISDSSKKSFSVCDVGGGYGYDDILLIEMLKELGMNDRHIAVDVIEPDLGFYKDVDNVKDERITYEIISFIDDNIGEAHEGKYDIMICSEVIEHLNTFEKEKFFYNFNTFLKKGGLLIVSCPNGSSIQKNLQFLYSWIKKDRSFFLGEFTDRYSHIGVPTLFEVISLMYRKGFTLTSISITTFASRIAHKKITYIINSIFFGILWILPFSRYFFSSINVFSAIKSEEINKDTRYNKTDIQ